MAAPLHALTGKYARCEWTEECQFAFEKLKEALTPSPIITMPSDEGRYILDTDPSETSIGAIHLQFQNGEDRVIAYSSRTYNKSERNYCTTRKELHAVIYFIRQFKKYLLQVSHQHRSCRADMVATCVGINGPARKMARKITRVHLRHRTPTRS